MKHLQTLPMTYAELAGLYEPGPIETEGEFERASEFADRLAAIERTESQERYLRVLRACIHDYEEADRENLLDDVELPDVLQVLTQSHNMSASDLGRLLGDRALGSRVLRGERGLSKSQMLTLSEHFGVGPQVFLKARHRS